MAKDIKPKEYKIPSRDWGITAEEAADILLTRQEIKANKPLHEAALVALKAREKAIGDIV